jgi:thiol-disulfide isomerase/thioredoxin
MVLLLLQFGFWSLPAGAGEPVDFVLQDVEGAEYRLSDFRGKWVLVNYWATWCPPCIAEMPELEAFHQMHKDRDAVVVGVNMESIDPDLLRSFVRDLPISYPVLMGEPATRTELGKIPGLPTSYLVSPAGEVVARQVGMVNREMLEKYLNKNHKGSGGSREESE